MARDDIKLLYVDLFCGAGGTSTGVEMAKVDGWKCAKVVACVNHDPHAIASHAANHPDAMHFTEDIRTLELGPLADHVAKKRMQYPDALLVLWASLECTNFSRAKGGMPRDADSRTLAEHLFRYIEALSPDYIQIENVEEFMSWGDLDENGKPVSRDRGRRYLWWVRKVCRYGYRFDRRILNAADYGAYTSRRRFFGQFAAKELPIVWPEPRYSKTGGNDLFYQYERWKPVREVLDLEDTGESIFGRQKPLVEKTLSRIYAGLVKFVAGGEDRFMVKWNSVNGKTGKYVAPSIDEPSPTVACQNRLGLAKVQFLSTYYGNGYNASMDLPAGTVTTKERFSFVSAYYTPGYNSSVEEPVGTVTTEPRFYLINSQFLMNPQFQSAGGSLDAPCFTLIASMDKRPPYLISTELGLAIAIEDGDSPMTRKIKEFMAMYGIVDVKMRMLKIEELKRIMGFPTDYVLVGTQAERLKYIGNAVEVNMSRVLCEAICERLDHKVERICS